jgi:aspartyl-tRNA(Asn)/glutamyl-tRNA(Gln) amidotransferase subunit A
MSGLTLTQACAALEAKEASSVELTSASLAAIAAHDGALGAFLAVDEAGARAAAEAADARRAGGDSRGPLDGVPVAVKDNMLTEGVVTTAGSRILEGYVPPYSATVVEKLRAAGAVIVGKLNCDEFAMGSSNENSAYGLCRNPWNPDLAPGGSSGGSAAAVAARLVPGTLGTDTGGSIRQPASMCGVVGLKPTYGRVSRFGVVAFASSLDQVGPLANDVEGVARLFSTVAGHDPRDSTSAPRAAPSTDELLAGELKGKKVGVVRAQLEDAGVDPEVRANLALAEKAARDAGAEIVEVELPNARYAVATYYLLCTAEAASNLSRYDGVRYGPRRGEDGGLEAMYTETRGALFGDEVKRRILLGNFVLSAGYYDAYYRKAQRARRLIAEDYARAFERCDLILGPTSPTPAFHLGEKTKDPLQMYLSDIFTIGVNLAALPAVSLPAGFTRNGLPVGAQLTGRAFAEPELLGAARALERALDAPTRPPDLSKLENVE